jgi:cell division protein FtsQ
VSRGDIRAKNRAAVPARKRLTDAPLRSGSWSRRTVIGFVAILVLGTGAYAMTFSSMFHARTIRVTGSGALGDLEILRLSGIASSTNVFHLDVRTAERRLETDPRIASATIAAKLPSTLVITVAERAPVAITAGEGGPARLVGEDGVTMGPADRERLPMVRVPGGAQPDAAQIRVGASVAGAMSSALRSKVASIFLPADGSVRLLLRSGMPVSYGSPTELAAKAQALSAMLRWADVQHASMASVDVSVPGAPIATRA